jgi:hypothetical protein
MLHFLNELDYPGKDEKLVHEPDALIVGSSRHVVHKSVHVFDPAERSQARDKGNGAAKGNGSDSDRPA